MPKYGGIGGQGAAVYLEAKEDVTLKQVWKKHPNKRITAGKSTIVGAFIDADTFIHQAMAKTATRREFLADAEPTLKSKFQPV